MSSWRPGSNAATARRRAEMLQRARDYFASRDVLAVDTPALSRTAASDVQIESFSVSGSAADYYLHTSPESCMKRLLAAGYPDIYSISRVFRDGECGPRHQPEFTIVEWYRRDFDFNDICRDTVDFIAAVLNDPSLVNDIVTLEYVDAVGDAIGIDPLTANVDALADAVDADAGLRSALGQNRDDWLDLIVGTRIAGLFPAGRLTVLRHYPASQAALARLCPANPGLADRFEVFLGPMELANGYVELTDGIEQQRRFDADQKERANRGRPQRPIDEALIAALDSGLPDCAGVAVGFERLHMLYDSTDDIRDVLTFAIEE